MALATKATVNWMTYWDDIEQYLDDEGPANWRAIFRPLIAALMLDQGKRIAATFGFRWDVQNLYGRDWFNSYILKFATDIFDTTKKQLRNLLNQGMAQGWSIEKMANNMGQLFDAWVNSKTVLPPEAREWFVDRLPQYRLEAIARTETIRASNYGSMELYREWGVRKHEWISTQDDRTRAIDRGDEFEHLGANGEVVEIGQPFMRTGEPLMYPGDPEGDPANTINCVIGDTEVLSLGFVEAGFSREYTGEVIEITTSRGNKLTVTPNHPILTNAKFVPARVLKEGDKVCTGFVGKNIPGFSEPNIVNRPASIEQVYRALNVSFVRQRVVGRTVDFHGDGRDSNVDIVTTDRVLRYWSDTLCIQHSQNEFFARTDLPCLELVINGAAYSSDFDSFGVVPLERASHMSSGGKLFAFLRGHSGQLDSVGLTSTSDIDPGGYQSSPDGSPGEFEYLRQLIFARAFEIHTDEIINVNIVPFSGHVYNLQTTSGMFIANGIITHNCRCSTLPIIEDANATQ